MRRASLFGGNWWDDGNAGSRQANVAYNWPENSNENIGARGRCEHRILARGRPRSPRPAMALAGGESAITIGGQPAYPASANTFQGPAEQGVGVALSDVRGSVRYLRPAIAA